MDELVHHCLRELAFDGDLGCNVHRLRDFVAGFYSSHDDHSQLVDDPFFAFVWSIVIQQPSVRVGTLPPGSISEVYIAPQASAKRKAAAKGREHTDGKQSSSSLLLARDARGRPLEALKREHGDNLRIAVDPETSFAAITGSHIRPPKLSPMVYTALQFITRGREDGITTVELGRKTGYDQKTCFYLIKQLVELGLVIKARRGGVGNHICIHKYFVERSPLWQQIQEEEARNGDVGEHVKPSDAVGEVTSQEGPSQIQFDPIDSRHLSSLPLVKNRIVKLLKASRNCTHPSNNLLMTIGFVHPTKTDRRFFQTRLRELIQQGVIERVLVPSSKGNDRMIKCIRLVTSGNKLPEGSVVVEQDMDEDEKDASMIDDGPVDHSDVKANLTIHKQVSNMLEEAGPTGLTLNEICASLGNFDKRTIELLLTRASNNRPPAHLGDLGTIDLMETYGRERRHRYFTLAAYKCVLASEQLQDTTMSITDVDLSQVGGFAVFDPKHFYATVAKLHAYQDSYKDITTAKNKKRKRDEEGNSEEEGEPSPKPKRGRPRKMPLPTDVPAAPPKKRGRPRKDGLAKEAEGQSVLTARSRGEGDGQEVASVPSAVEPSPRTPQSAPAPGAGVDKGQSHFLKATRRCASKPSALGDKRRDDNTSVLRGAQPSESEGLPVKLSISAAQEEPPVTAAASEPIRTAAQGSLPAVPQDPAVGEKHTDAISTPSPRPSKRSRTSGGIKSRPNINISALRRENELLKVIENMGGVTNMLSKDIFDAHTALLDGMSHAKEPTSAPAGTRLDKRTAESTLKSLENNGRVKMLKTSLVIPSGVTRPACLVYLPDTPQDKVNAFLRQLTQHVPQTVTEPVTVLKEPIEFGPNMSPARHAPLPLNLLQIEDQDDKENERLKQLFSYDSRTIRDVLLTERTTVAQLYGFIVGKALRLRQLHLHTLDLFQQSSSSPLIISQEHRIIDITYFNQDITLALYCTLVAVVSHNEDLDLLFASPEKHKLVKDLAPNLHMSLGIGRSRNKSRILELLEMLRSLALATPLERTDKPDALFKCIAPNGETFAFQNASPEGWTTSTPMLAPMFWRFHTSGPIYLWVLSESFPSYWKEYPTRTLAEGNAYWEELRKVSRDQAYAHAAVCPSTSPPIPTKMYAGLGRCLRRRSSWDPDYALTWHQKQYLTTKMDPTTGRTPLNAEDMDAQLDLVSYVTSAPREVVANYFTVSGERLKRDLERVRQRIKRNREAEEAQGIEAKSVLRKKAEEARAQRERDWEDLLHKVHPEPLKGTLAVRVRAVKSRFMQSTTTRDQPRWQNDIGQAIQETQLVSKKITSQPKTGAQARVAPVAPPPVVPNPPEKPAEFLIAQQGPPIMETVNAKKKGKAKEDSEASRRPRFHWTREFDELARDASAIIRARCRTSKLDLSAFDQVFPAVPRNSVRQRITHLRESTAEDVYMKRLEDQWCILWLQYRGTPYLPDEDPGSPSNFNLINHIEFLRKHVDKNALRVGFVEREASSELSTSVEELHQFYDVEEDVVSGPAWDFMWSTIVEESREKLFRGQSFTIKPDIVHEVAKDEKVQLAEEVLKMVFGTPSELYDPDTAAQLLHSAGDQCVSVARSNLLHQGVLSKLVRDPTKAKPGRMLKISDANLNSLSGPFPRDLLQDAVSLENVIVEKVVDEMEWPLVATEGDVATLVQLVSEDRVSFALDLTQSRAARPKIDWNSKRADDEDIETSIQLKFFPTPAAGLGGNRDQRSESPVVESVSNGSEPEIHGTTPDGNRAACSLKMDDGLINCSACINTAFATFASSLSRSDGDLARRILDATRSSKGAGLSKSACLELEGGRERHILSLAHRMTLTSPPILLWRYFDTPILIAGDYCSMWSVAAFDGLLIAPRRWFDLRGYRLDGAWGTAQQAVVGVIFLHPGITQTELRWRLRTVYDRQEIIDLVSSLQEDGVLECRTSAGLDTVQSLPGWVKTVDEEDCVFWFIANGYHWYQI